MGFVNGKTDADLLIEQDDIMEDEERVFVLKVPAYFLYAPCAILPSVVVILRRSKRSYRKAQRHAFGVRRAA